MNPTEIDKVLAAVGPHENMRGELKNFLNRAPTGAKHWVGEVPNQPDAAAKKLLKEIAVAMLGLIKNAKKVVKDIESLQKELSDKHLAKCKSVKDFKAKATKLLASSDDFNFAATSCVTTLKSMGNPYPGQEEVACKASVDYLDGFVKEYKKLKVSSL